MYTFLRSLTKESILYPFIDVIFPPFCYICDDLLSNDRKIICSNCWQRIPRFDGTLDPSLKSRDLGKLFILFEFDDSIRLLIHLLKYRHHLTLAKYFANEAVKRYTKGFLAGYQAIIPVPLHKTRKRDRGYNQSEQISIALGKLIQTPVKSEYLVRIYPTVSQTRLSRVDRDKNVKYVFSSPSEIIEKKVLLVDDVITTGSTIEACSVSLKRAGVTTVDIIAIAHPLVQSD